MYKENPQFIELLHRVLRDELPGHADVAVLYGETQENEGLQLAKLAELWHKRKVTGIALSNFAGQDDGKLVVSGFRRWSGRLVKDFDVSENAIVGYDLATELPPCTDAEARGFVRFAKRDNIKSAIVVVPPLHAVRAFVSTVTPAVREYPELKVYVCPNNTPPWTEEAMHSQSAPKDKRKNLIASEFEKMERYFAKGDLLSVEEVLAYLDRREDPSPWPASVFLDPP